VTTDAVVFALRTLPADSYRKLPVMQLRVLLYQRADEPALGRWSLPGGFLNIDELPEDNARRKLSDKALTTKCYLEQLYTFCDLGRDPRARVISVVYLGLMREADTDHIGQSARWFTLTPGAPDLTLSDGANRLVKSDLAFDHGNIIQVGLERLQAKIVYADLLFHLLPAQFTLTQMQNAYETILGRKESAANFRRKMAGRVVSTGRYVGDKGHRPAELYTQKAGG